MVMTVCERPCSPPRALRVGFYDIEKTLGKGNFAVVKLARHRVTKTQVAIKIIDKTRLDSSNLEKIYREVQIMKLLNHPHIIKLYQVMETKDMLYMVTEYAQNGEMFDYLSANGPLSEAEARRRFCQILTAVEYCHNHHIVHRDLKTENLLLDANMNIKIAGTVQANTQTHCSAHPVDLIDIGDLYSNTEGLPKNICLGVVLYVLVCGSLPFDGPTLPALRQRVLEGRFRIPFYLSQACENLIRRMLVVDPTKRVTMSQIKQHHWMQSAMSPQEPLSYSIKDYNSNLGDYNEQVLGIMQSLGINKQKTIESLQNSSYNHFAAIYYLLLERVQEHRSNQAISCPTPGAQLQKLRNVTEQSQADVPQEALVDFVTNHYSSPGVLTHSLPHSVLQNEMDCDTTCFQPIVSPVDASVKALLKGRSMSPCSLLETAISEEVRMDPELEEELMGRSQNSSHVLTNTCRRHTVAEVSTHFNSQTAPCIVVTSSAHPQDGASSDSCLTSCCRDSLLSAHTTYQTEGVLAANLAAARMTPPFMYTASATPILQEQGQSVSMGGAQLPVTFQEGRRASDTSLTSGLKAFRHQLRKSPRAKGFIGLNKIKGFARQVCQSSHSRAARNRLGHLQLCSPQQNVRALPGTGAANMNAFNGTSREARTLLEELLDQQRMLQLTHQQSQQLLGPCLEGSRVMETSALTAESMAPHHQTSPFHLAELTHANQLELSCRAQSQLSSFMGACLSPLSPNDQLLDSQLPQTFSGLLQQRQFSLESQNLKLLSADCEMEDLTAVQLGKIVLVN
uniref:non-specific serine/threonine protein kinase n=1 Tax=Callorhinchus milii TaxID=7868 RepID=A0A4W3HIQ5_CALMI